MSMSFRLKFTLFRMRASKEKTGDTRKESITS